MIGPATIEANEITVGVDAPDALSIVAVIVAVPAAAAVSLPVGPLGST